MMEEVELERDAQRERCTQLEAQLEISQKIVDTQEAALAAKEVSILYLVSLSYSFIFLCL